MLYILKFLVSFVFPPGLWVVLLMVLAGFFYRRNRRWARVLLVFALVLYASSTSLISDPLVRSLEAKYEPPVSVEGDVIVVLMGGATADAPGIGGPGHPSGETAGRLITAASLYSKLGIPIIVSAGQVYGVCFVSRIFRQTSQPSIPGIMISNIMRS